LYLYFDVRVHASTTVQVVRVRLYRVLVLVPVLVLSLKSNNTCASPIFLLPKLCYNTSKRFIIITASTPLTPDIEGLISRTRHFGTVRSTSTRVLRSTRTVQVQVLERTTWRQNRLSTLNSTVLVQGTTILYELLVRTCTKY
jgi:hypothetical protein